MAIESYWLREAGDDSQSHDPTSIALNEALSTSGTGRAARRMAGARRVADAGRQRAKRVPKMECASQHFLDHGSHGAVLSQNRRSFFLSHLKSDL